PGPAHAGGSSVPARLTFLGAGTGRSESESGARNGESGEYVGKAMSHMRPRGRDGEVSAVKGTGEGICDLVTAAFQTLANGPNFGGLVSAERGGGRGVKAAAPPR